MEEEGARRRAYRGRGGVGRAGFLAGLNEDDENVLDDEITAPQFQASEQQHLSRERKAYDGCAGQRDIPRSHGRPFELSIDGATLLGRRQLRDAQSRIPINPSTTDQINADSIDAAQSPMHY